MILHRGDTKSKPVQNCHHGTGTLWCAELLADYRKPDNGFKYIHDNVLEPNASIGEHRHENDEELYVILSGHGVMKVDGANQAVEPGDVCLTRHGHSHDLTNGPTAPMHFLVVCANTRNAP